MVVRACVRACVTMLMDGWMDDGVAYSCFMREFLAREMPERWCHLKSGRSRAVIARIESSFCPVV